MARIDHIGLYVTDLEAARSFFETYLDASAGELYHNPQKGFRSYFLKFNDNSRLEIMTKDGIAGQCELGNCHIAISTGSKEKVDTTTASLAAAGYAVLSGPRTTGDGYYESLVCGIDGNLIEITE